jgi:hypothetical protein
MSTRHPAMNSGGKSPQAGCTGCNLGKQNRLH